MTITDFESLPLLAILRGITKDMIEPIADVCTQTGIKAVEITMNTKYAPELISILKLDAKNKFLVGAGTVLTLADLDKAIKAGAQFIVTPTVNTDVIRLCALQNIPIFAGAFTPTEIQKAWDLGAYMVKVFPSSIVGPSYFKEVKGPLNNTKLLACGGVNEQTIKAFFTNGADAAAFGASVFKKEWLENNDYNSIKNSINALISAYKN